MWLFNQASSAARIALIYITVGSLVVIWTAVWYLYLRNYPPVTATPYYWCGGFLATGLILIVIGLGIGRIGREARHADMPAEMAPPPAVNPQAPMAIPPLGVAQPRLDPAAATGEPKANVAAAPVTGGVAPRSTGIPVRHGP